MGIIRIERLVVGMLHNNVYCLDDGTGALLVDPGAKGENIASWLGGARDAAAGAAASAAAGAAAGAVRTGTAPVDAIALTHFHSDHTGAARLLRSRTGARVYAHVADAPLIEDPASAPSLLPRRPEPCIVDVRVDDGDELPSGGMRWRTIHTPGHSAGSVCWYLECDSRTEVAPSEDLLRSLAYAPASFSGILIAGDTLFEAGCGRTDFELGNPADMERSLARLSGLPDDTLVLPGHGNVTTIAAERRFCLRS